MYATKFVREFKLCCCCYKRSSGAPDYQFPGAAVKRVAKKTTSCTASSSIKEAEEALSAGKECLGNVSVYIDGRDGGNNASGYSTSLLAAEDRSITPPHIAHGRGTKAGYEKYLMI